MANQSPFLSTESIRITNGPGKFDLMSSIFDFKQIEITCEKSDRTEIRLKAIFTFACPEDGSKESWLGMINIANPNNQWHSESRAYYYNSKSRTGHLLEAEKKWKIIS